MMMDYLTNGGRIEVAHRMAGQSNTKTTGLCHRGNDDASLVDRNYLDTIEVWRSSRLESHAPIVH